MEEKSKTSKELIIDMLKERSCMKQDVYTRARETFEMLKELLTDRDTWQGLLVGDVMQPLRHRLSSEMNLGEALQEMNNNQIGVFSLDSCLARVFVKPTAARFFRRAIE